MKKTKGWLEHRLFSPDAVPGTSRHYKVHGIANKILPPGTRRRLLARLALTAVIKPKAVARNLNRRNIREFLYHLRATDAAVLNNTIADRLQDAHQRLPRRVASNIRNSDDMPSSDKIEELGGPQVTTRASSFVAPERPRITYISGEPDQPGHIYRVERYAAAAKMLGAITNIVRVEEIAARLPEISRADILIIWRARWDGAVALAVDAARQHGAAIVFDVDDLMFEPKLAAREVIDGIRSQELNEKHVQQVYERVRMALLRADYCIAPTPLLAQHMRQMGKPTWILPNGFDEETLRVSRMAVRRRKLTKEDGLIRIGYAAGTRTHQRDFRQAAGAVARVLREHPNSRLVLFYRDRQCLAISEFPELASLESQIEWRAFVPLNQLPDEMARFDINIAPLEVTNLFCEAKSELKYFEAALVGVPTVASPTEPFRLAIRDAVTGFLAETEEQWYEALSRLVKDAELRRQIAQNAFHDVLWSYGPERQIELMAPLIEQVLHRGRRAALAFQLEILRASELKTNVPTIPQHEIVFEHDALRPSEVTVVIPLHNYRQYITQALNSVRRQTIPDIDVVVVDDVSTDDSPALALKWLKQHAERFNRALLVKNATNAGLDLTRNVGFAEAETSFVLPLDPDNELLPDCVAHCLEVIKETGASFVYPQIQRFGDDSVMMGYQPFDVTRLAGGNYIDAMALVRKAAWSRVGGYDLVYGWEDYDLWCKFAESGMFGWNVPEVLARYRVHEASLCRTETEVPVFKRRLVTYIQKRHPWLKVPLPAPDNQPTICPVVVKEVSGSEAGESGFTNSEDAVGRLNQIIPLLRCPETCEPLELADGNTLRSARSGREWPIVHGRPILFPGLATPKVMPQDHISNPLSHRAQELIKNVPGWILNLSAGGTICRCENVVEVEAAIFHHTDIVADAHILPFADNTFSAVIAMNAFEHYHSPLRVASEIYRVLRPGGQALVHTAFLQPTHEAPWHFYNVTRYGLEKWFEPFEILDLQVSDNFNPAYAISWLLSEAQSALQADMGKPAAEMFRSTSCGELVDLWRKPALRHSKIWRMFFGLSQTSQEKIAAGFELFVRKPYQDQGK